MHSLKGTVAIITGGANGIGAGILRQFVKEGAKHVRILDIDETSGVSLQDELNQMYGANKVKFVKCDISDDVQLFGAIDDVTKELGYIDILVNNAGVTTEGNSAEIRKEIEINLTATVNGTIKVLELMRKDKGGKGGSVINISSITGIMLMSPMLFVYGATKCAVNHFSNCIGKEEYYAKTGVRVITVCFSATDTAIVNKVSSFDEGITKAMVELVKMFPMQSIQSAGRGIVEVYQKGESGSTWVIQNDEPAKDLSATVAKVYGDLEVAVKVAIPLE